MKTYKSIAYAYPTSTNAEKLDCAKTGCWHISKRHFDIEGSGQNSAPFLPHNAEGFDTPDHPDLVAILAAEDGEIDPLFLQHGNPNALNAYKQLTGE